MVDSNFQIQLGQTIDLDATLKLTVQYGVEALPAAACSVRLLEGNYLLPGAAVGVESAEGWDHRVLLDDHVLPVMQRREVLRISDLEALEAGHASEGEPVRARQLCAYLGIPLLVDKECIGLLSFYREAPHAWTDAEIQKARDMAAEAGRHIRNARVYRDACDKARRLDALQHIVRALNSAQTSEDVFQTAAARISQLLPNDRMDIALYDPDEESFSLAAVAMARGITSLRMGTSFPAHDTEMSRVVQTHQPLVLDQLRQSTYRISAQLYFEGIRSLALVPILSGSDSIGCIAVGSRSEAGFTSDHVALLSTVSDHLSVAVRNLHLYEELRYAEEYIAQILQTTPDAILALDLRGRIREFNRSAEELFSRQRQIVLGKQASALFPVEYRSEFEQFLARALSGRCVPAQETFLRRGRELPAPVQLVLAPHRDRQGNIQGVVVSLRDLSNEYSLQERLSYGERLRMLGELASGVAHNLNNGLFPITAYAQELLENATDAEDRELLELIRRAAWDCTATVKRIQSFTAIQAEAEHYRVDMAQVIRDAVDFTRSRWRSEAQVHGVNIQVTVDYQSVPPVSGSEAELKEVLANLIFNAVDAMLTTGGQLQIGLADDGEWVHVMVRDTGIGMTQEVKNSAFKAFFTTKGARGTGLGLRTAYNIAIRHGGSIEIAETAPGVGTTFRFSLPVDLDAPEPEVEEHVPSRPTKILVVDDDPEICELIASHLEGDGHEVFRAIRGDEALLVFEAERPAVVFTDLSMPDMSGWELAREVKRIVPSTGVALITGWGTQRLEQKDIEESRIDLVLGKPLRDYQVLNAVARLVRR